MRAEGGSRIFWSALPEALRTAIEAVLGGPVVTAVSQPGGFSPGSADRVVTATGRRAFVKAVSTQQNPASAGLHRREIVAARALPTGVPAPRLLGWYDDGTWVALAFEDVEGRHPRTPWDAAELDLVLAALERLAVPVTLPPPACEALAGTFGGWQRLSGSPDPGLVDPWLSERVPRLVELAAYSLRAVSGENLVHDDVRADNLLLTPHGEVLVVDWPFACRGAPWLDSVQLLVNVRLYGGHDTNALLRQVVSRFGADPRDAVAVLVASLGYFLDAARQPPPPGLPALRAFQRAQGMALLGWLKELPADYSAFL